jgi:hypothetical protein
MKAKTLPWKCPCCGVKGELPFRHKHLQNSMCGDCAGMITRRARCPHLHYSSLGHGTYICDECGQFLKAPTQTACKP